LNYESERVLIVNGAAPTSKWVIFIKLRVRALCEFCNMREKWEMLINLSSGGSRAFLIIKVRTRLPSFMSSGFVGDVYCRFTFCVRSLREASNGEKPILLVFDSEVLCSWSWRTCCVFKHCSTRTRLQTAIMIWNGTKKNCVEDFLWFSTQSAVRHGVYIFVFLLSSNSATPISETSSPH
jgi:hypothetical protein